MLPKTNKEIGTMMGMVLLAMEHCFLAEKMILSQKEVDAAMCAMGFMLIDMGIPETTCEEATMVAKKLYGENSKIFTYDP